MHSIRAIAAILAAGVLAAVPATEPAEAQPGEGKKKRLPKPSQEFEQGPMTRQQRRHAERKAKRSGQ